MLETAAMVTCKLFLVAVLTLVCTLFRVQIGGDDNGAICVSCFISSHKGNQWAGRICSMFIREVRVKAQQTPSPQLPFISPGQTTELSLIAGGLLEFQNACKRRCRENDLLQTQSYNISIK